MLVLTVLKFSGELRRNQARRIEDASCFQRVLRVEIVLRFNIQENFNTPVFVRNHCLQKHIERDPALVEDFIFGIAPIGRSRIDFDRSNLRVIFDALNDIRDFHIPEFRYRTLHNMGEDLLISQQFLRKGVVTCLLLLSRQAERLREMCFRCVCVHRCISF